MAKTKGTKSHTMIAKTPHRKPHDCATSMNTLNLPRFFVGSCYSIFSFMCIIYRSLFVLLSFFIFGHCVACSSSIYGF